MVWERQRLQKIMKGIYVLLISISQRINVEVGAKGTVNFERGLYMYVGSGQSNLEKRLKRHLGRDKLELWHIDYLLKDKAVKVLKVFFKEGEKAVECETAKNIGKSGVSVKGFGSSDCKCLSHLFRVNDWRFLEQDMQEITEMI
jgi:Uri superfamily endonuclease